MKEITIITTSGCAGCTAQINSTRRAIEDSHICIKLNIVDFRKLTRKQINEYRDRRVFLKDFPTTVFTIDGQITFRMCGSTAHTVMTRYIDLYIKGKR